MQENWNLRPQCIARFRDLSTNPRTLKFINDITVIKLNEAKWIRNLLINLQVIPSKHIIIFKDN